MTTALPARPFLYPLTDSRLGAAAAADLAVALFEGGAGIVQLRDKSLSDGEMLRQTRRSVAAAGKHRGLLFVNDRFDVALLAGADGIHVGDDDLPVAELRRLAARLSLDRPMLIGRSSHSVAEALAAADEAPDYIALGPIFASSTKPGRAALHPDAIWEVKQRTSIPLVAIGGIDATRLQAVVDAGADGIAVVAAVMVPGQVRERCGELLAQLGRR